MYRIIACSNIKGGEGKTTLARHLAHYAEDLGLKTLAIDLDPQGDLSASLTPFGHENDADSSSAEIFFPDFDPKEAQLTSVSENLFLLRSTDHLDDIGELDKRSVLVKRARKVIRVLADGYDLVVIDTPTNAQICYQSGMAAAHVTVSPLQLDTYGMRGATKFMAQSTKVKSAYNPELKHVGFVVNRFNSRAKSHHSMIDEVQAAGFHLIGTVLRERAAVQDALDRQMPVWRGPRGSVNRAAAKEFKSMSAEVLSAAGVKPQQVTK